jgi:hypothetical protein
LLKEIRSANFYELNASKGHPCVATSPQLQQPGVIDVHRKSYAKHVFAALLSFWNTECRVFLSKVTLALTLRLSAMLEEVLGPRHRHKVSLGHFQEKPMTFLNKARY